MLTVSSIISSHRKVYEYWRAHKRDATATADEFQRTPQTVNKWRDEESWAYHADQDDALDAEQYVKTHDMHKAEALGQAYNLVAVMLANTGKMQVMLMEHIATKQADAMEIGAAGSYAAKAIAAADTLYSISKLNVDISGKVQHEGADITAIRMRLEQRQDGAQA